MDSRSHVPAIWLNSSQFVIGETSKMIHFDLEQPEYDLKTWMMRR